MFLALLATQPANSPHCDLRFQVAAVVGAWGNGLPPKPIQETYCFQRTDGYGKVVKMSAEDRVAVERILNPRSRLLSEYRSKQP